MEDFCQEILKKWAQFQNSESESLDLPCVREKRLIWLYSRSLCITCQHTNNKEMNMLIQENVQVQNKRRACLKPVGLRAERWRRCRWRRRGRAQPPRDSLGGSNSPDHAPASGERRQEGRRELEAGRCDEAGYPCSIRRGNHTSITERLV